MRKEIFQLQNRAGFAQKVESIPTLEKTYRDDNAESVRQFQPRVALWQPLGKRIPFLEGATLKELRPAFINRKASQPPTSRGCEQSCRAILHPGFQSKHSHPVRAARPGTPAWAGICQRLRRTQSFGAHEFRLFVQTPSMMPTRP